eukprot:m.336149 g.336149  ORF g.336149 m.336149 type:complete len:359 (+) comp17770_c0_seq1:12-1088(+)
MGAAIRPEPYPDRLTGEDRRKKIPPDLLFLEQKPIPALLGASSDEYRKGLRFDHGLFQSRGIEKNIYWTTIVPDDIKSVKGIIVFHHGYGDHCGYLAQNQMLTYAKLHNFATVCFDMPGFGRSDGLFMDIPDWFDFVEYAVEFANEIVLPLRNKWSTEASSDVPLPLFCHGESMGGGVVLTLCIKHPNLYDAAVLSCPMLAVAKETRPPYIVELTVKNLLVPLMPRWPVTPSKDLIGQDFKDPKIPEIVRNNPLGPGFMKPRLQSARSLAFQGCEWMENNLDKMTTPFLAVHSKEDTITDPALTQMLFDRAQSTTKDVVFWEDGWHADAFHGGETRITQMEFSYKTVANWLQKKFPRK